MRRIVPLLLAAVVLVAGGCVSRRHIVPKRHPRTVKEPPLPEIPGYPELQKAYDVSAKVCVYPTLWISKPIEDGLRSAGYGILPPLPPKNEAKVERPDFIIEPLSFKHTVEKRAGELWLFTRIVLQVRSPLFVETGETGVGEHPQRVFQVFARRNIGAVAKAGEADYRANVATAVENLLRIEPFRESLVRK